MFRGRFLPVGCTFGMFLNGLTTKISTILGIPNLQIKLRDTGRTYKKALSCVMEKKLPLDYIARIPVNPEEIAKTAQTANGVTEKALKVNAGLKEPCITSRACKELVHHSVNQLNLIIKGPTVYVAPNARSHEHLRSVLGK